MVFSSHDERLVSPISLSIRQVQPKNKIGAI